MKKFLIKLLIFLLPFIVLAYPLDWLLSKTLEQSHMQADDIAIIKNIKEGQIDAEVYVYGSSRAWVHFDPAIMQDSLNRKVYNFGVDGHNFWLQYQRHEQLLKYNPKPKAIILSVDVFSLQRREDLFQMEQFLPFMYGDMALYNYLKVYKGYSFYDFVVPLWRYIGKPDTYKELIQIWKGQANEALRQRGFKANEMAWTDDLAKARLTNATYTAKIDTPSIALFEQFIQECKAENIELYLVYSPEHIDGQAYIANRQDMKNILEGFVQQYKLPYLDYTHDAICSDTTYFYNSMHLNGQGARLFTKQLMHDMKTKFPHLVKNN